MGINKIVEGEEALRAPAPYSTTATYEALIEPISQDLERMQTMLRTMLSTDQELNGLIGCLSVPFDIQPSMTPPDSSFEVVWTQQMAAHLLRRSGKNLRASLVLTIVNSFTNCEDSHLRLAGALELIHTATLIHDDVIDEAQLRRGQPSLHTVWGNKAAVLMGDYLITKAFLWLADGFPASLRKCLAQATAAMCRGEIMQLQWLGDYQLSQQQYFDLIAMKTAELMGACTASAAMICPLSPDDINALHAFGFNLGMAFQIVDDVLDFHAHDPAWGKMQGKDIQNGKYTLPMIVLLETIPDVECLVNRIKTETIDWSQLTEMIKIAGGFQTARAQARKYAQRATKALEQTRSACRHPQFFELLYSLVEFVISREH